MRLSPEQTVRLLIYEAFHYRKAIVVLIVLVNICTLVASPFLPRIYTASTTILVDEKNIIRPLMQGAAVTTEVSDRAKIAMDVIYGRKIMDQILKLEGWSKGGLTPVQQDATIASVTARTKITNAGTNLIKIEFKDADSERAFKTTQKFAELFIHESLGAKADESRAAFEFISSQTKSYHEKLIESENQLKEFRLANLESRIGNVAETNSKLNTLQSSIEQANQDLQELDSRKLSIENQLSGEANAISTASRIDQFSARISELQGQLETLLLSYHETYPDVIRIRHQISDLTKEISAENQRVEVAKASGRQPVLDTQISVSPLYQQLKLELSQTKTKIDTLKTRLANFNQLLKTELARGRLVHVGEAQLAELTRDYNVNRSIYNDLSSRREAARVSMHLDQEKQGLTFKISEPAVLPRAPSGIRSSHFVMGGFLASLLLPVILLFVLIEFDPRIRAGSIISKRLKLPVLSVVPHLRSPSESIALRREMMWWAGIVVSSFIFIALVVYMRTSLVN